jgi:DnaK suppressor protein
VFYARGVALANTELDQEFVEQQRQRLEQLREELVRLSGGLEEDQRDRAEDEGDMTENDSGDMSQSLFTREVDATVEEQVERRLRHVERALQKIEEGTYGLSDDSGGPYLQGSTRGCARGYPHRRGAAAFTGYLPAQGRADLAPQPVTRRKVR